jgi:hypothetical protein
LGRGAFNRAGGRTGGRQWDGRGVVRAVYPHMVMLTHEEIPGLRGVRTTGFPTASRGLGGSLRVGDAVQSSPRGTVLDDAALVVIEP